MDKKKEKEKKKPFFHTVGASTMKIISVSISS